MGVPDVAVAVDEVLRRPVLVAVGVPGRVIVVERDRIAHAEAGGVRADVGEHVLERELGGVDAEDDEPLRAVGAVPALQVGQRSDAVDARVRPEVDEDDLPAERGEGERTGVQPLRHLLEVGRLAVVLQPLGPEMALAGEQVVEAVLRGRALLEPLQRLRVPGYVSRELHVEAEGHEDRDADDEAAEGPADERRPRAERLQAHPALGADGDEQQDEPGAERVGERDEHALNREALGRGEHGDRGDDGPGARREEQAEADAEEESAAHPARVPPPERLERALDERAEPRPEKREADEHDDADGDVTQEVVRKPES